MILFSWGDTTYPHWIYMNLLYMRFYNVLIRTSDTQELCQHPQWSRSTGCLCLKQGLFQHWQLGHLPRSSKAKKTARERQNLTYTTSISTYIYQHHANNNMAELERHFMCVFSSFLLDSIPQVKACCTKAPVELLPQGVVFSFKFWHSAEQNFTLPCETSELNVGMIRDDNKEPRLSRQNKTL